jgi:hypothetical protein
MVEPSSGLHKALLGNTFVLHHLPSYLMHKKLKHMHFHMTEKDIQAIIQISIDPKFEIRDFMNEL